VLGCSPDELGTRIALELDGVRSVVRVAAAGESLHTSSSAATALWTPAPRFAAHDHDIVGGGPHAPLPGTIIAVHVSAGDNVVEGQALLVLEAMKMEHTISAPAASTVTDVLVAVGDRVDTGDLLVELASAVRPPG
jgi:biotin carboxyl carrier protein